MRRLRRGAPFTRFLLAVLLVLCLGERLLTPSGFMPSFADGSLAIVECPAAEGAPAQMAMPNMPGMEMPGMTMPADHQHDDGKVFHQTCPYAGAASLTGLEPGVAMVALIALFAALAPLARTHLAFSRSATRDRPPSQGPPLPA
jgi:hypothetical protein